MIRSAMSLALCLLAASALARPSFTYVQGSYVFSSLDEEGLAADVHAAGLAASVELGDSFHLWGGVGRGWVDEDAFSHDVTSVSGGAGFHVEAGKALLYGRAGYLFSEAEGRHLIDETEFQGAGGGIDLGTVSIGESDDGALVEGGVRAFVA